MFVFTNHDELELLDMQILIVSSFDDMKSISNYVFKFVVGAISWKSV